MTLLDDLKKAGTETVDVCNACRSTRYMRDARFESLLCLSPTFGVRHCRDCGLRWLSPRPNQAGCRILYSRQYYFQPADEPIYETSAMQRQATFRTRSHDLAMERHVRSVLDWGAATGDFVALARDAGLMADGVEFSADARQQAQDQYGVHLYSADDLNNLPERFDAIHMNHVLEHMPDPMKHLQWCRSKLRRNGWLIVEVPRQFDNDPDRLRRILRQGGGKQTKFNAFSVHHTYYFSPRTLAQLVRNARFVVESLSTRVAPFSSGNPSVKRKLFELVTQLTNRFHHGGDIIELWARQPQ